MYVRSYILTIQYMQPKVHISADLRYICTVAMYIRTYVRMYITIAWIEN